MPIHTFVHKFKQSTLNLQALNIHSDHKQTQTAKPNQLLNFTNCNAINTI